MTTPFSATVAGALSKALGAAGDAAGSLKQFFLWQVVGQLAGAALAPALADIQQAAFTVDANIPLTPEQLAVGVLRKILDPGNSQSEAAKSGIGSGRFDQLLKLAASPPALSLILAAYQRDRGTTGAGASVSIDIDAALADLGIEQQYWPLVKALSIDVPTAQAVMEALLEGQIDRGEALSRYVAAGGDPDWFDTDYNRQGEAPTPVQALEMLNRGLIAQEGTGPDSTSWEQSFLEGPWRNKWAAAFLGLRYYVTPPRSVVAQLRSGAITTTQALQKLQASGLDEDTAAQFIAEASHHASAAQRALSMTQIIDVYESHLIEEPEALAHLVALGYTSADAQLLLSSADLKAATASIKAATNRLRSLYLSGHNTVEQTRSALVALGVTSTNAGQLLAVWDLERVTTTRTLTEAQIVAGWWRTVFTQEQAQAKLEAIGYGAHDAWVLLSIRNEAPLPDEPGDVNG